MYLDRLYCGILIIMKPVKLLKNCINVKDAQSIIDYINKNQDSFVTGPKKLKFQKMFGKDNLRKISSEGVIFGLDEIEKEIKNVIDFSIKSVVNQFQETEEVYLSSIWLTKQLPGADVPMHQDIEGGANKHYVYSAILYLSTNYKSSPLEFPRLTLNIVPEFGDLVMFESSELHEVKTIDEERYAIPMWFTKDKDYELRFA